MDVGNSIHFIKFKERVKRCKYGFHGIYDLFILYLLESGTLPLAKRSSFVEAFYIDECAFSSYLSDIEEGFYYFPEVIYDNYNPSLLSSALAEGAPSREDITKRIVNYARYRGAIINCLGYVEQNNELRNLSFLMDTKANNILYGR